jgi:hypothetical protein
MRLASPYRIAPRREVCHDYSTHGGRFRTRLS